MPNHLSDNPLVRPPFADNPPIKLNLDARVLGLVLMILGIAATLTSLLFVVGVSNLCNNDLPLCSFPTVDVLGAVILLAGWLAATIGFALMYTLSPAGRVWAVYGLIVVVVGDILALVGNILFVSANSLYYSFGTGAIAIFVFWLVVGAVFYYLVVTSRSAGESSPVPPAPPSA
jgi:uncharacterized membrane protein